MKRLLLALIIFNFQFSIVNYVAAQYPMSRVLPYLKMRGLNYDRQLDIWAGVWINVPDTDPQAYGVYYFRKDITLDKVPQQYAIHVTGDNRYKLYVNDNLVSVGPARGDLSHWNVSKVDLAPYLKAGKNVIAAQVCNYGTDRPMAMFSVGTGFLIDGEGDAAALNTNDSWLCIQDKAYQPTHCTLNTFFVAGPGDAVDMNAAITDWRSPDCDLSKWQKANPARIAMPHDCSFGTGGYDVLLVDNKLPEMERTDLQQPSIRKITGMQNNSSNSRHSRNSKTSKLSALSSKFSALSSQLTIPANSDVIVIFDQKELTNAYANLTWSKGRGATLTATYCEAAVKDAQTLKKGNRDDIDGLFLGRNDSLISNGADGQTFQSTEWRTFRYIKLHIVTKDEALTLNDIHGTFTGYPFKLRAQLNTTDNELKQILEIGWRTQRLCAYETYMDCPYYEQLQYMGDTRIQALTTLYNTADPVMVKNFLTQGDESRNAEGCTQGRYPTSQHQYITPYALSYVYALHDFMRYCQDDAFLKNLMSGAEGVMAYFARYQQADGRLCNLPGWNFSDWVYQEGWNAGVADRGADHCSALMDLQLLMGYQMMSELEQHFGNTWLAAQYKEQAARLAEAIQKAYWDSSRGLYADASNHKYFSQHANALAILCGLVKGDDAKAIARKLLPSNDSKLSALSSKDSKLSALSSQLNLALCSVYYKYYLHAALIKAGLGDEYLSWLDIWRENIRQGLTTWAETSDILGTRSDCHAWGASPSIEIYRTVLGIDSDAPGFKSVRIEPHLAGLKADKKGNRIISGTVPHPQGDIVVDYNLNKKGKLSATITLPAGITGSFVWNGETTPLTSGTNTIVK